MNKLPNEILNIIFNYYWSYKYSNIVNEIDSCVKIDEKIRKYLYQNFYREKFFKNENLYDLKLLNKEIKNIVKNKTFKIICKINNLKLYYCYDEKFKDVCKSIDDELIYIAMFSICCDGHYRYYTFDRFQKLSKYNKSSNNI